MRRPSAVTVISMWLFSFSKSVICLMACCNCSFRRGMLSRVRTKFSPRSSHVGADFLGVAGGVFEISANGFLNLLAGVEKPENDKERHHGGDEIGVGDLPCAAMVAAVAAFFLEDDDGTSFVHDVGEPEIKRRRLRPRRHLRYGRPVRVP